MPAKDIYHDCVRNALVKDGWTITDDPLWLRLGVKDMFVDLGAERLLIAEKQSRKIAVEVKSFVGASSIVDLRDAVGQFVIYQDLMEELMPDRTLYLAVRRTVFADVFEDDVGKLMLRNRRVRLVVFDPDTEGIVQWIP